jgi:hypothetical protein
MYIDPFISSVIPRFFSPASLTSSVFSLHIYNYHSVCSKGKGLLLQSLGRALRVPGGLRLPDLKIIGT